MEFKETKKLLELSGLSEMVVLNIIQTVENEAKSIIKENEAENAEIPKYEAKQTPSIAELAQQARIID